MRLVFKYSRQVLEGKAFHLLVLLALSRYCMQSRQYPGFSYSLPLNPDISLSYRINLTVSLAHHPSKVRWC